LALAATGRRSNQVTQAEKDLKQYEYELSQGWIFPGGGIHEELYKAAEESKMTQTTQVSFNPNQLATWKQARELKSRINSSRPFKNVGISVTDIFIPEWVGGPGGFQEPQAGGTYWLHFNFSNGSVNNVGLILTEFGIYPESPGYVFTWLLTQVSPK
jgi:hypothetical protein